MTRVLTTIILLLLTSTAFCADRETIRDATGKVVGTATTSGNKTIYRDATGKPQEPRPKTATARSIVMPPERP